MRTIRLRKSRTAVVLLHASVSTLGVQAVHTLARAGHYRVTALSFTPTHVLRYSRQCRYIYQANWRWDAGPQQLDALARELPGAILLPLSTDAVAWTVRHSELLARRWRLPALPTPEALNVVLDKAVFTRFAASHGLHVPPSAFLPPGDQRDFDSLSFPVLLKPRCNSGGGTGIEKIATPDALHLRLQSLQATEGYFAQSYVSGQDISCGVLCRDGRLLAAVAYTPLARCDEFGTFRSIQIIDDLPVLRAIGQLMHALRWNGLANVDLRRSETGRIYFLELNPRFWGNMRGVLISGVNFADLLCRTACGEFVDNPSSGHGRYFGTLDSLALMRDLLLRARKEPRSRWLSWRESSFQFIYRDPLLHWMLFRQDLQGSTFTILRLLAQHEAPQTNAPEERED